MPRGRKAAVIARIVDQGLTKSQAEHAYVAILAEITAALEPGGARPRATYAPPQGLFLWSVEYRRGESAHEAPA